MTLFKNIVKVLLGVIILLAVLAALIIGYWIFTTPKLEASMLESITSSKILDKDGNEIADLGSEERDLASTDEVSNAQLLSESIISIEDKRFRKHKGTDLQRILGAAWRNLISDSTQGGSTIEQQLIKLSYFSTSESDQNLKRKVQEAVLSRQMNSNNQYSKDQILTLYMNKVYMGNGFYGMKTAAQGYFGKNLDELTISQAAFLAGLPQAPSSYDPYTNIDAAEFRRKTVLRELFDDGKISKKDFNTAVATPVTDGLKEKPKQQINHEAYLDNYLKEVINQVEEKTDLDVFGSGLTVYTNLDTELQQYLWNLYNFDGDIAYPNDEFQVASTIIDVETGNVVAQLGSRNQADNISFGTNQAVQTDRDWGSTMKPITDYAPAIENGIYTSTNDSTNDSRYNWPGTSTQIYNWDRQYQGNMSIQTAIQQSRNIPAVKALEAVGLDYAANFLEGLGIKYPELYYSNAISSSTSESSQEYGASSEKMAAAYAAFANGGTYMEPMYINKVLDQDGNEVSFQQDTNEAMSDSTAYLMAAMLKSVITGGTATGAGSPGLNLAGKTGTSNYSDDELAEVEAATGIYNNNVGTMAPDSTFVGFSTKYSMAVWTGYKNRKTPVYGSQLDIAKSVFRETMNYLSENGSASGYNDFQMPDSVVRDGNGYAVAGRRSTRRSNSNSWNPFNNDDNRQNTTEVNQTEATYTTTIAPTTEQDTSTEIITSESITQAITTETITTANNSSNNNNEENNNSAPTNETIIDD